MSVSVFRERDDSRHLESAVDDIRARLSHTAPESIEEGLRYAVSRLVDALALEGGLLVFPEGCRLAAIAVGGESIAGRALGELLALPRVRGLAAQSELMLVIGAPHDGTSVLPADDHLHLWALGIRTLILVPLAPAQVDGGLIALFSRRSLGKPAAGSLRPLTTVADAIGAALQDAGAGDSPPAAQAPARPANAANGAAERQGLTAADDVLLGESAAWRYVMFRVDQVAGTHATVLLMGETGTGKELVARAIHRRSPRTSQRYVALNCAALPAALVESELFGRERGAFTGAHSSQPGRFELAHRGTLFLDEVGDLALDLQPKLLRVLQEGQFERLGSTRTLDVDVRVVAATNRDLAEDVRQSRFREDLYYRLNVFPITLPALRERREDIPLLAQHLADRYGRAMGKPVKPISDAVARSLQHYDWPGNIRELENVIQRAIILSPNGVIAARDISLSSVKPIQPSTGTTLEEVERSHIQRTLNTTLWRIEGRRGAAELLGLRPSTLRSRLRKLGITRGV